MIKTNFTDQAQNGNRSYSSRGDASLAKFNSCNGQVYGTLTIDSRRKIDGDLYPVAIRVAYDQKNVYLRIGKRYTKEDWMELCECEKQARNKRSAERKELKVYLDKVANIVNTLIEENGFSLQKLKRIHEGKHVEDDSTIYSVWNAYIQGKLDEGKAGSARCSREVLRRFERCMGLTVAFVDVNRDLVLNWLKIMKKGGLNPTTIGISMRTFRTIVNICIDRGLIKGSTKEMFKDTGYNKSCSRKHEFLDVDTMKMLYDFWDKNEAVDEDGKEIFLPNEKQAVFHYLGIFLFMYLGDGQNLADTLRLTYDEWYFSTHGQQLRFYRHKTRDRNESASEVIFPVTPELQRIMDRYANKPKLGKRVFPNMNELLTPEKEVWVIQRYNRYIREHMQKVATLLGMEQYPTSTWARHSFATNLNNSGHVPYKYISDSMGHSSNGDITSNYIGAYPIEKMLEYNWFLLNKKPKEENSLDKVKTVIEMMNGMSEEERNALILTLTNDSSHS